MQLALAILAVTLLVLAVFESTYVLIDKDRRAQFAADARTVILYIANLPMRTFTIWQLKALVRPKNYQGRHRRTRTKLRWSWRWFKPAVQ